MESIQKLRIKRIAHALLPLINESDTLLDIGCGDGSLGACLQKEKNVSYHGIDIVEPKHRPKNFTKSAMPYPIKDKSFNVVLIILALHHMDNPLDGLQEAKRLAKKKILILEDVPRNWLELQFMKIVDYVGNRFVCKEIPLPYTFKTDKEWKALFEQLGLNLRRRKNVFPLPFPRLNHYLYEIEI